MNIPSGTLLTAFILSFIGLVAASVFDFGLIGQILSVASMFCVAVVFLFLGAFGCGSASAIAAKSPSSSSTISSAATRNRADA